VSLILDSSAALAWIFPDETTDAIRQVFRLVADEGAIVPTIWRIEVANGLTQAVRRGRFPEALKGSALADLALLDIEIDPDTNRHAWTTTPQLADRFHLTIYDAAYLELGQRQSLPIASLDVELRKAAEALGLQTLGL
jgi:predicted nucleic acid-binding protein